MSLINDILKNLERRKETSQPSFIHQTFELQDDDESLFLKALAVVAILALLGALVFGIVIFHKHHATHLKTVKKAVATDAKPVITPSAPTKPITTNSTDLPKLASAIHINDLTNSTEVEILFNKSPTYMTSTDSIKHTVSLTLDNTYLDIHKLCKQLGSPQNCSIDNNIPLPINGTALESVHIDQNDGQSLTLTFQLTPKAQLLSTNTFSSPDEGLKLIFSKGGTPVSTAQTTADGTTAALSSGPTDITSSNGQMVESLTSKDSEDDQTPYQSINALMLQQNFSAAQQLFNQLPPKDQHSTNGVVIQAKIYLGMNKNAQALKLLESTSPDNQSPDYYAVYAATLAFNKQYAAAVALYKKLIVNWPDNPYWWLGLAIAAQNNQDDALATNAYQHVISFNELAPEVLAYANAQLEKLNIGHAEAST